MTDITPEAIAALLDGLHLGIDRDCDAYIEPFDGENNLVALPARDDDGAILHPEVWAAMVERFNALPTLRDALTAAEAQLAEQSDEYEGYMALLTAERGEALALRKRVAELEKHVKLNCRLCNGTGVSGGYGSWQPGGKITTEMTKCNHGLPALAALEGKT